MLFSGGRKIYYIKFNIFHLCYLRASVLLISFRFFTFFSFLFFFFCFVSFLTISFSFFYVSFFVSFRYFSPCFLFVFSFRFFSFLFVFFRFSVYRYPVLGQMMTRRHTMKTVAFFTQVVIFEILYLKIYFT